jgi:hypothetical protein
MLNHEVHVAESRVRLDSFGHLHQDHILLLPEPERPRSRKPWQRIACVCAGAILIAAAFVFADIYRMISSANAKDLHVRPTIPANVAGPGIRAGCTNRTDGMHTT